MTAHARLTDEQRQVIEHPAGEHAIVLAVAGSGKTTTLVRRVEHLVRARHVPPERILVLMFNALARKQFREKAAAVGLPAASTKLVHTFHSYAYTVLRRANRLPPASDIWIADKAELQRRCVHAAITELVRADRIGDGEIDPEEALSAIGMWKGALVPPERAGYRGHPAMPEVYRAYERLRTERRGITFDDFIPLALDVLRGASAIGRSERSYAHVIVDEYQDVNLGQQVLVETIAGDVAEVMVVGDDDQTIYEWRGARPDYIRRLFAQRFPKRETRRYTLTRSFRFGPLIAQCADNVIAQNADRHEKRVVAHEADRAAQLSVVRRLALAEVDAELCAEIAGLRDGYREHGVIDIRDKIVVLGRTFSQMAGLEGELVRRKIPYRVVGKAPFLERREVMALLDYVRVARGFGQSMDDRLATALGSIVNMPNRRIPGRDVEKAIKLGVQRSWTPAETLAALSDEDTSTLPQGLRDSIDELHARLERLAELVRRTDKMADGVFEWLINAVDYRAHFRDYYGSGEDSFERLTTLDAFLGFAKRSQMATVPFVDLVDHIDPTCGAPEEEQVVLTTVHRTKGLEYDNVIIPSCVEGMMPVHGGTESPTFDLGDADKEPTESSVLENERRLFYVGITRARHQVLIGTIEAPKQGVQLNSMTPIPSRFLEELRLDGTLTIAGGVADCRDQGSVARFVREAVAVYRADPSLAGAVRNLAENYLPAMAYPRAAARMRQLLQEVPAAEFEYSSTYPLLGETKVAKSRAPELHLPPAPVIVEPEDPDAIYD